MVDANKPNVLFHFLHRAHHRRVSEEWNVRGLGDVGAPMILAALYSSEKEGTVLSQRELARALPSAADISTTKNLQSALSLKNLEGKGYLSRTADVGDQRRNLVQLTDKGRDAVEKGSEAFLAVEEQMLADFSEAEKEQLTGFFIRMLKNLGASEEDVPPPPPGGPFGPPPHHRHRHGCVGKECEGQ